MAIRFLYEFTKKKKEEKSKPILYYIHGGGFFGGTPDVVEESVKMLVEKTGICVVSPAYRLAPENPYPTGHTDCFSVLEWIYQMQLLSAEIKTRFL